VFVRKKTSHTAGTICEILTNLMKMIKNVQSKIFNCAILIIMEDI